MAKTTTPHESDAVQPDVRIYEKPVAGFLWFGDQHLGTRRPERRYADYNDRILAKIEHGLKVAKERNLIPVFAGDLWHHPREEDDSLKTRVMDLFGMSDFIVMNPGNHDIQGLKLSKKDSLSVVAGNALVKDKLHLAAEAGPLATFQLTSGRKVMIGASPYGTPIPFDISDMYPDHDRIWLTHHDMAFEGSYPGSTELTEIKGAKIVMNGHMHLHRAPVAKGETLWCNFGALGRTAIDAINETPAVWEINEVSFTDRAFERHVVPHQPGPTAFDMTGRLVQSQPAEAAAGLAEVTQNTFIQILRSDMAEAVDKQGQNGIYSDELIEKLDTMNAPAPLRNIIMKIFTDVQHDGLLVDEKPAVEAVKPPSPPPAPRPGM